MTYTKPQQRKKEESERLRGDRDQIEFIDLRLEIITQNRGNKSGRSEILSKIVYKVAKEWKIFD